ncbi:hypothetical protein CpipJ_CPIJ012015 [Culex quinquefasciatus]|uniref:Uncharacterized protein n=1 Tax=Culex quinquefasciatus TaxID=7176 RepID=B0WX65_CULQU|nr:hypothetical protein CpipJ_CPIJ012015 [Culex quinquefasciatus]|eukprot:XP_001861987.1 hypothetical protein CpipJ_CPIJ012015 [Culex quinquefasciatus]
MPDPRTPKSRVDSSRQLSPGGLFTAAKSRPTSSRRLSPGGLLKQLSPGGPRPPPLSPAGLGPLLLVAAGGSGWSGASSGTGLELSWLELTGTNPGTNCPPQEF